MIQNVNDILAQEAQLKDFVKYKTEFFVDDPDTTKQQLIDMVNGAIELWKWYLAEMLEEAKSQKHQKETAAKKVLIEKFLQDLEAFKNGKFNKTGGNGDDD